MPFFVKTNAAGGENFRRRSACARHYFATQIDVVISHVQLAFVIAKSDQMAANNLAAAVLRPDDISGLMIMKNSITADLAGLGILDGAESPVVVANPGHRFQYPGLQPPPSFHGSDRTQILAAKR